MNVVDKLKNSWWVILSFIIYINGAGFLYIGFKNNNRDWVLEGIIYEIPWLFYVIFFKNPALANSFFVITVVGMFISIIRSFWVAIKLADIYGNEEKYKVRPTNVAGQNNDEGFDGKVTKGMCCVCLAVIFLVFGLIAIL